MFWHVCVYMWIRIRHYIKASWPLGCLIFLSPRLFVYRLNKVSKKDTVQIRDHSVFAPSQWEATLSCYSVTPSLIGSVLIQNVLCKSCLGGSLCGKKTDGFPASHHELIRGVGLALQGFACFLLTWLSPWTNSQVVRKISGIDAHVIGGLSQL